MFFFVLTDNGEGRPRLCKLAYLSPDKRQLCGGHGQGGLDRLLVLLGLLHVPSPLLARSRSCHLAPTVVSFMRCMGVV